MAFAPGAHADSSRSSNWAGYAVHRSGVSYRSVFATWRQPSVACTQGTQTYSAYWVGLGGFQRASTSLDQIGTEADCSVSGRPVMSAWYELVPAPSSRIKLTVRAGDVINASVTAYGHRVVVSLNDITRHRAFKKTLHPATVDVSSAEWIVEAPSNCIDLNICQTLPLANFGTSTFTSAGAKLVRGHAGSISDPAWGCTRINLTPGGRQFVVYHGPSVQVGTAAPGALRSGGSSFTVIYSQVSVEGNPFLSPRRTLLRSGHLVHSAR
jgi:Peptidase A4 family